MNNEEQSARLMLKNGWLRVTPTERANVYKVLQTSHPSAIAPNTLILADSTGLVATPSFPDLFIDYTSIIAVIL